MKYLTIFLSTLSFLVASANAEELIKIESCQSVIEPSEMEGLRNEFCEITYSNGFVRTNQGLCELEFGCPQDMNLCAYIFTPFNWPQTEEEPNYEQLMSGVSNLYNASHDCVEGERNGAVYCEIVYEEGTPVSTQMLLEHPSYEGITCDKYPGCKGFTEHCQNSLTTLKTSCEAGTESDMCDEYKQTVLAGFIDYLLAEVYISEDPITPDAECIDHDGDGWGWIEREQKSCKVLGFVPVKGDCIDTDGDGWGWDGLASCIP